MSKKHYARKPKKKSCRKAASVKSIHDSKLEKINELPRELRGLPQNKWGGHETQCQRVFRNNTFGPASPGRTVSDAEKAAWATARGYECSKD